MKTLIQATIKLLKLNYTNESKYYGILEIP